MCLHPEEIPPIPNETVRVAKAAFPKGNLYMRLRDELGWADRYATSDSGGWVQFDNFRFDATYEGDPASAGIQYKKENGDWENVENYPGYSGFPNFVYIPSIAPCKS